LITNNKKFKALNFQDAISFFTSFSSDLNALNELKQNTLYYEDLIFDLNKLSEKNPSSLLRLLIEKTVIPDSQKMIMYEGISIQEFMRKQIIELFPFISKHFDHEDFQEFYSKYCMMVREFLLKCIRNPSRQRRSLPKYYEDFNILLNDANYHD
jgi:hypothetical protein